MQMKLLNCIFDKLFDEIKYYLLLMYSMRVCVCVMSCMSEWGCFRSIVEAVGEIESIPREKKLRVTTLQM